MRARAWASRRRLWISRREEGALASPVGLAYGVLCSARDMVGGVLDHGVEIGTNLWYLSCVFRTLPGQGGHMNS